ncbi:DUF4405 domain-containing protein [candidate division CSSED10-310 bacterium]|uniref:DUF4405 domain-containing protein n=1 Tax=candidate division CSSED10-310 bacterium TaxID=2855610 RepID=A0ABV6Z0X5_UNCC1
MKKKGLQKRGLTSFLTLAGFLVMSITGIILYIVPQGRIAYWIDWKFLWLTKTDWGNIHILSSLLFIMAGIFHIYFNWKPLMKYFFDKVSGGIKLKKELSITLIVTFVVILSSLYNIPPLSLLIELNEYIKGAWIVQKEYEPPFGHAEQLSLKVFTKKMNIDLEKAVAELKKAGIAFSSADEYLENIARDNETSPLNLYMIIKQFEKNKTAVLNEEYTVEQVEEKFTGTGLGRKTLAAVCEELGINLDQARKKLQNNAIIMQENDNLKDVADKHHINSIDILKVLLVENFSLASPSINDKASQ